MQQSPVTRYYPCRTHAPVKRLSPNHAPLGMRWCDPKLSLARGPPRHAQQFAFPSDVLILPSAVRVVAACEVQRLSKTVQKKYPPRRVFFSGSGRCENALSTECTCLLRRMSEKFSHSASSGLSAMGNRSRPHLCEFYHDPSTKFFYSYVPCLFAFTAG